MRSGLSWEENKSTNSSNYYNGESGFGWSVILKQEAEKLIGKPVLELFDNNGLINGVVWFLKLANVRC